MLHKLEVLKAHIQKLNRSLPNKAVVVEGKNDVLALRGLLKADFFILNKYKRSLYETAEVLSSRYGSALLLLDSDRKGKELRKKMKSYLQMHGVSVQEEEKLLRLARVRAVEDLSSAELVRLL